MKSKFYVLLISTLLISLSALAQTNSGDLQQKFSALKQSAAQNQQKLHQYRWLETTQVRYKGELKPETQKMCSYGPDGTLQKVPMSQPAPQQQSGRQGKFKQRVVEKKKAETADYMKQVQSLLALYVPPNSDRMQRAFQAHNVSIVPGGGAPQLVFKNYAQPGDQMTITIDPSAKKMESVSVNTYLDEPKDVVTLNIQFASLPDGTSYPSQTVLNAIAKQIQVTTTNSNYEKVGQ